MLCNVNSKSTMTVYKSCSSGVGGPADLSSRDVQPTVVPMPPPYSEIQAAPGQVLLFDRGLMEAVTNAQHFVAQTFAGARLLENHNVSYSSV